MASNTTVNANRVNTHSLLAKSTLLPKTVAVSGSTYSVKDSDSGCIHLVDCSTASGLTITLPQAKPGLNYEFHISTAGDDLTINAASTADTLQGIVFAGTGAHLRTNAGDTTAFVGPAAADHQFVADADTKGRLVGTHLTYECVAANKWQISGSLVTAGTVATPFT